MHTLSAALQALCPQLSLSAFSTLTSPLLWPHFRNAKWVGLASGDLCHTAALPPFELPKASLHLDSAIEYPLVRRGAQKRQKLSFRRHSNHLSDVAGSMSHHRPLFHLPRRCCLPVEPDSSVFCFPHRPQESQGRPPGITSVGAQLTSQRRSTSGVCGVLCQESKSDCSLEHKVWTLAGRVLLRAR